MRKLDWIYKISLHVHRIISVVLVQCHYRNFHDRLVLSYICYYLHYCIPIVSIHLCIYIIISFTITKPIVFLLLSYYCHKLHRYKISRKRKFIAHENRRNSKIACEILYIAVRNGKAKY